MIAVLRRLSRGFVPFARGFVLSDIGATPDARWLRAVAHAYLGNVAGLAVSVHPPLLPWLLAAWAAFQAIQWGRDGWTRRSLRDAVEDTGWTLAGLWLGAITSPRDPVVWCWSAAALGVALIIRGALLAAPKAEARRP